MQHTDRQTDRQTDRRYLIHKRHPRKRAPYQENVKRISERFNDVTGGLMVYAQDSEGQTMTFEGH